MKNLLFALLLLPFSIHAQWNTVGSAGFSSGAAYFTSIAISGSGTPYVVYSDYGNSQKATVMKYNGSRWLTVGSSGFSAGVANVTSIAIDGSGTPYVVYEDGANSFKATVMKYNGSSWVTVGSTGFSAGQAITITLALDGSGTPYVAYRDAATSNNGVTVMKYNGSSWVTVGSAGFTTGAALYTSIAIDGGGSPYVAYVDSINSNRATVMKYNGSNWVTVGDAGFSTGATLYTSLAIDGTGTPYVAYEDNASSSYGPVTVMKYDGSSWITLGSAGFSAGWAILTKIAIDGSGVPNVVYEDNISSSSGPATVMKYNGSSWVTIGSAGFSAGQAVNPAIAFGSGIPYVVYEDFANSQKATVMEFGFPSEVKNAVNSEITSLSVFPNPNKGLFTLNISTSNNEDAQIIITNILGEKVKELMMPTNKEKEVQLQTQAGIYFISAVTNNGSITTKIVVE